MHTKDHTEKARELLTRHQPFGEMHAQARCTGALMPAIATALSLAYEQGAKEVRREAMEECCKLVCGDCAEGLPVSQVTRHWVHPRPWSSPCEAWRIRAAMAAESE